MSTIHGDHVTQRVISSAFHSMCEEMGHTMIRTANSSLFVEGRDFSCAIVDSRAELIAAANYDPSHLSAMALTVEFVCLYFGIANIFRGDVYLVNDPFRGGGHLPDVSLIRPVFTDDGLLGFAVNRAHHLDIGGMAVAGFSGTARNVFQEGLRIPPIRWHTKGVENRDVIELVLLNVRFPKDQLGDFQAQLASTSTAEKRLLRLAAKYGVGTVRRAMEECKDHSEQLTRLVIRDLPDGCYRCSEYIDDDGVSDQPYRIDVAVTVSGDRLVVDFTGTSPQAGGPINSSFGNTLSSTFNAVLQLLGSDIPFNNGCFRAIEVIAPRGSLLNPVPPAACFGGPTEVSTRVVDAVLGALAPVAANRAGAGCYGTCINFSGGGFDTTRGADFGAYFFIEGGWGATAWRDGWNCTPNPTSNFNDYPVEWVESTLPVLYLEAKLNTDSGGPGRWRGGVGTIRTLELTTESVEINGLGERFIVPPFGLAGGDPGSPNGVLVGDNRGAEWRTVSAAFGTASPSKFHGLTCGTGTRFRIVSGGGGGYGRALERPAEAVIGDVRNGFVSCEGAARDYGVVIESHPSGLRIDEPETEILRRKQRLMNRPRQQERDEIVSRMRRRSEEVKVQGQVTAEMHRAEALLSAAVSSGCLAKAVAALTRNASAAVNSALIDRARNSWSSDSISQWLDRHGDEE